MLEPSDIVTCRYIGGPLDGEYEARRDVALSARFDSFAPMAAGDKRRRSWYRRDSADPLVFRFAGWLPAHDDTAGG